MGAYFHASKPIGNNESEMATVPYTFQELLSPLPDRECQKLAMVSAQTKIEQMLLAEIVFNGNKMFSDLDFYLEEDRRDLTVARGLREFYWIGLKRRCVGQTASRSS